MAGQMCLARYYDKPDGSPFFTIYGYIGEGRDSNQVYSIGSDKTSTNSYRLYGLIDGSRANSLNLSRPLLP